MSLLDDFLVHGTTLSKSAKRLEENPGFFHHGGLGDEYKIVAAYLVIQGTSIKAISDEDRLFELAKIWQAQAIREDNEKLAYKVALCWMLLFKFAQNEKIILQAADRLKAYWETYKKSDEKSIEVNT